MKPLELTIYPKAITYSELIKIPTDIQMLVRRQVFKQADERLAKRLTSAELAAEYESARCDLMLMQHAEFYWAPLGDTWSSAPEAIERRAATLLRFATLPHYDEEVTP